MIGHVIRDHIGRRIAFQLPFQSPAHPEDMCHLLCAEHALRGTYRGQLRGAQDVFIQKTSRRDIAVFQPLHPLSAAVKELEARCPERCFDGTARVPAVQLLQYQMGKAEAFHQFLKQGVFPPGDHIDLIAGLLCDPRGIKKLRQHPADLQAYHGKVHIDTGLMIAHFLPVFFAFFDQPPDQRRICRKFFRLHLFSLLYLL